MKVFSLEIPAVKLVLLDAFWDDRGCFTVHWHDEKFRNAGINTSFYQDSYVTSERNVVRGLHYQLPPFEQGKLVRCMKGAIQDVAVDIRKSSPTYGKWVDIDLHEGDNQMLWIPPGFAHGYAVLEPDTAVFYKCTELHAPQFERSLLWNDSDIGIKWKVTNKAIVSDKDQKGIPLKEAEVFE
jgi:dTDP-4-dehydrorhamnose 3,5-epimerase